LVLLIVAVVAVLLLKRQGRRDWGSSESELGTATLTFEQKLDALRTYIPSTMVATVACDGWTEGTFGPFADVFHNPIDEAAL
jgi:hypothetical protein